MIRQNTKNKYFTFLGEDWFTFRDNFHRNLMLYNAATDEKTLLMENTTFVRTTIMINL